MELMEMSSVSGKHRETAIDVPESFVGVVKQAPRYPPPPQMQVDATGNAYSRHHHPHINNNSQKIGYEPSSRLSQYTTELQSRKKSSDAELFRCSLRGSKKLQQLVHHSGSFRTHFTTNNNCISDLHDLHSALVNPAFESDELMPIVQPSLATEASSAGQLQAVLQRLCDRDARLSQLVTSARLPQLLSIYTNVLQQQQTHPAKLLQQLPAISLVELVQETLLLLQVNANTSSEAAELLNLLTKFELDGLCHAFDKIHHNCRVAAEQANSAQPMMSNAYTNVSHQMEVDELKAETLLYDERLERSIRIVRLEKESCEPLGVTIKNEPDSSVVIARIVKGGAAEKCGLLNEGDEILEINGMEMEGRNVNQISDMLSEMSGAVTFVLASRDTVKMVEPVRMTPSVVHLRALFDYDPEEDIYIPCRELGICFSKGDIIHVIDQTDLNWWQAYKQGEHEQSLAGLVPSIHFQLQRESMKQSLLNESTSNYKSGRRTLLCGAKRSKKKHRAQLAANEEPNTYEEVHLYYPRANMKRPIVMIGPTNIGRHELRQRLMLDTERFAAAVPHTSRSRRDGEMDGVDYHFISRSEFELHIKQGKFVEHGQYEGNYYGTSLGAIEAVVQSGKICVLNLHVHSIHVLRQGPAGAKLKPYFVFVAPPTQLDRLNKLIASTTHQQLENVQLNPADLQAIIEEAREIEAKYGHFFDMILSITDIDRSFNELLRDINALEREPQWIPKVWLK